MSRGSSVNTVAIILAIVVIVGLGYYISFQKETATPAGSAAAPYTSEEECEAQSGGECDMDISNWKLYENKENKFSLMYPNDWNAYGISDKGSPGFILTKKSPDMLIGDYKLSLAIKQNPKRLTGKEYVAGLIEDAVQYDKANPDEYPRTPIICTQDGLLDAEDYLIRDWTVQIGIYEGYWFSTFGGDGCGVSIFIPRGDFIFEFSFTEWRENPNFFDTLRNYKIARRIADTLKFLD